MYSTEQEADARLATAPADVEALIAKAEFRRQAGHHRSATAFFRAGLQAAGAEARTGPLPLRYKAPIERAQRALAEAGRSFAARLLDKLTAGGFGESERPSRFQQSLDLLMGKSQTQLQLQRPTAYYYPGLPQRRYLERTEFPWAAALEQQVPAIREELAAFSAKGGEGFTPYLARDASRPTNGYHGLLDNPSWSTLYLTDRGRPIPALADAFPRTLAALASVPLPSMGVRSPSILFSRLKAGAHIPPHHGMVNARLICHLPLVVPAGCGFRVGGETREWREGELLVFDDSIQHEAWNRGNSDRTLLIFNVWRPELDSAERRAIDTLFRILDQEA